MTRRPKIPVIHGGEDVNKARPHINGNRPEEFKTAGRALHTAATVAIDDLVKNTAETLNSRNYQHLGPDGPREREKDMQRVKRILDALRDMKALGIEIFKAGER